MQKEMKSKRDFLKLAIPGISILGEKILSNPSIKLLAESSGTNEPKKYSRRDWLKLVAASGALALGFGYALHNFLKPKPSETTTTTTSQRTTRTTTTTRTQTTPTTTSRTTTTQPTQTTTQPKEDTTPPSISSISFELAKKNNQFVLSTQAWIKDDSGIKDVWVEYSYAGYASKDHMQKIADELYFDEEFLPFNLEKLDEQGKVKIIARDVYDNEAFKQKTFSFRKLLTNYDKQNPVIQDVEFRLANPSTLELRAYASDDVGIKDVYAELSLDGTSKNIELEKKDGFYAGQTEVEVKEQTISATIYARDYLGKEGSSTLAFAYVDLLKQIDKVAPTLTYRVDFVAYDKADKVDIEFSANDNVKLKESYVLLNGKKLDKLLFDLDIGWLQDMNFEFVAVDLAGNQAKASLKFSKDEIFEKLFSSYVSSKGYEFGKQQMDEMLSIKSIELLFENYELRNKLKTVFDYLSKNWKRIETLKLVDELISEHYIKERVFPEIASYLDRKGLDSLSFAQAKALVKYMEATKIKGYAYDEEVLDNLLHVLKNENGTELIDFKPLVFKSVDGNDFVIRPKEAREIYTLADFAYYLKKQGIDLAEHAELYEAIREKIISNNWQLYDAPYGISYYEMNYNWREIKPDDKEVKELIALQWDHWKQFSPQFGDESKLHNRSFPWWDSKKLRELYPDEEIRRQALFFMFFLWPVTHSEEKKKRVSGIEAARTAIEQGSKHYKKIAELYPDGTLPHEIWGDVDVRFYYYDFVVDRCTPLSNPPRLVETGKQYVGMYVDQLWKIITQHTRDFWEYIKDYDGIDQYLSKHETFGKDWDLVKFIMGFERWNMRNVEGVDHPEGAGIDFFIPQTLQYFGFSAAHICIEPYPIGTSPYEWAVSLPDYIINGLNQKFEADNLIYGRGNLFGLYNCKVGLIKDGVKEIYMNIRGSGKRDQIYLMKNQ